jgi:hypothetical protein
MSDNYPFFNLHFEILVHVKYDIFAQQHFQISKLIIITELYTRLFTFTHSITLAFHFLKFVLMVLQQQTVSH